MCEAFQVEDLALMIRATRGRSSRPNHILCRIDGQRPSQKLIFGPWPGWVHREIFKRPKNREDSSDFDDFWTK